MDGRAEAEAEAGTEAAIMLAAKPEAFPTALRRQVTTSIGQRDASAALK